MDNRTFRNLNFAVPFGINFDMSTGMANKLNTTCRRLSQMKGMFHDDRVLERTLELEDPLIYEFYELKAPEDAGDLAFGTSIVYPGKVGNEYFMTKGHFHTIIGTGEVYLCLKGHGYMLLENPEGDWKAEELTQGRAVYVPKRYAHRSINVGNEPFITFFTFRADAGHDYGTIETKGFRKLIVEVDGKPVIVDNPNWK
jgi:glucose-6-phosphate isomerase, archaeal